MDPHHIHRARRGETEARDDLYQILQPRIERLARWYARRCALDADDLIQEAWLGVYGALPRLMSPSATRCSTC